MTSDDLRDAEVGLWAKQKNLTLNKLIQVTGMVIEMLCICLAMTCERHYGEQPKE